MRKILEDIYKGQTNVAQAAQRMKINPEELKVLFRDYASKQEYHEDSWKECEELSWPFV